MRRYKKLILAFSMAWLCIMSNPIMIPAEPVYSRIKTPNLQVRGRSLKNIPIKYDKELIKEHKEQIKKIQSKETTYITKKLNAKQIQENVKFPETIRNELNEIMFTNFDLKEEVILLDRIHQNNIFKEKGVLRYI